MEWKRSLQPQDRRQFVRPDKCRYRWRFLHGGGVKACPVVTATNIEFTCRRPLCQQLNVHVGVCSCNTAHEFIVYFVLFLFDLQETSDPDFNTSWVSRKSFFIAHFTVFMEICREKHHFHKLAGGVFPYIIYAFAELMCKMPKQTDFLKPCFSGWLEELQCVIFSQATKCSKCWWNKKTT